MGGAFSCLGIGWVDGWVMKSWNWEERRREEKGRGFRLRIELQRCKESSGYDVSNAFSSISMICNED